jgi:ABC-type antimicrobial peptide transport system permease subunit
MHFLEGIINGMKEVWAHKFRSFLSMIGIILGVAALVSMVGIVEGMLKGFQEVFEKTGGLEKISIESEEPPEHQKAIRHLSPGRTLRDVEAIREATPLARHVAGGARTEPWWSRYLNHEGNWTRVNTRGTNPDQFFVDKFEMDEGRFIGELDMEQAATVVVLNESYLDRLYEPNDEVIGSQVRIAGQPFTVIGVTREQFADTGGDRNPLRWKNRQAFIPMTTAMKRLRNDDQLSWITVQAADLAYLDELITQIENVLLTTHRGVEDFSIVTRQQELAEIREKERTFRYSLGGVAGISLLVGGIGIMNVMLAVINERIREIGVRKAVGARGIDIFVQFLAEALLISVLGGLIGVAVSVLLIDLMRDLLAGQEVIIVLSPMAMTWGFIFSVGIGVLAGIYPAIKAAKLNVIESLRYE